jgi:hypothetical protein
MSIEIREQAPGTDISAFIDFANEIYRNDPAWIAPLAMEVNDRLSPKANPFFKHGEATIFTAYRDGKLVGRCTAQIDHEHLKVHADGAGFFGFFDSIDDPEVARALLGASEAWLRERGMTTMRGPYSLNINEEIGTLVHGHEHPPVLMMPHATKYQSTLLEACGMQKAHDVYAWHYKVEPPPERARKALEAISEMPEVKFRSVRRKDMRKELDYILEIFNDAWSHNWGFVPATPAEIEKMAKDMALLIDEDIAFFAEIDGRPVAVCIALPNLNEAAHDLGGKLFPFGFVKLLWRLKVKKVKSARLLILGIRNELRGVKKYGGLSTAIYAELARRGMAAGYEWAELGWTLESNKPINLGIRAMKANHYKTYRIYERPIPPR